MFNRIPFKNFPIPFYLLMILLGITNCHSQERDPQFFSRKRTEMVKRQIINRGISDQKVIEAMKEVKRHLFVIPEYTYLAYEDHPLFIGEGQTISQPYIVAFMSEALQLDSTDRVLEIGTGSGYQAAILAELCREVYTIEVIESLGNRAKSLLKKLKYDNIYVKIGDGYKGWKEHAPFDGIIVTCAPTHVPAPLKKQLGEGGRMIIPVGDRFIQHLVLLKKVNGKIIQENVLPVRFVPMIDTKGEKY